MGVDDDRGCAESVAFLVLGLVVVVVVVGLVIWLGASLS